MVLEAANERRVTTEGRGKTAVPDLRTDGDVVTYLAGLASPQVDDFVESLIAWTHRVVGDAEIVAARDQFYLEYGKVFHDDSVYDARMSYFFDGFLFERTLSGGSAKPLATPYESFMERLLDRGDEVPADVRRRFGELASFRHSLFEIVKVQEKSVVIQDLIMPGKLTAVARAGETFRGLEKKTIFQGFVFQMDDKLHLSHGLVLHPPKATRVLRRLLKLAQKGENFARKTFLCKTASLQVRFLRHRHVDPKTLYLTEPR